jgi:hypothetical protein
MHYDREASVDNVLELRVSGRSGEEIVPFRVEYLWNGGWAGRDRADVQRHVDELAEHGIAGPTTVPIYFPLTNNLITTADRIQVVGSESSGEIEYVLLFAEGGAIYVGVASDHTDRAFERHGIQASKQMYPDVLAPEVWPLEEVADHWDELRLRCWVTVGGERRLYQEAGLHELLSAEQWLEIIRREGIDRPGVAFLSGAPPTVGGLAFGSRFEIELADPVLGRALRHGYDVEVLPSGGQ